MTAQRTALYQSVDDASVLNGNIQATPPLDDRGQPGRRLVWQALLLSFVWRGLL